MNENKNTASSRGGKVGTTDEVIERSIKNKVSRPLVKKSSWTSLTTKGRRSNKKRKSSVSSNKTTKEIENYPTTNTVKSYGKGLEDYTLWCNHYLLRGLHREITPDLRTAVGDGATLINLIETLTSKSIHGISRQPKTWSQKLQNIHLCFQFLKCEGVMLHGISPEDIIEGQFSGILNFFNRLETHFECVRFPSEKPVGIKHHVSSADHGRPNGRISSGYHSEDDGYIDGRTTPILDILPGFLTGSDTDDDDDDDDVIEQDDIRLYQDDKMKTNSHQSLSNHFTPISQPNNPPKFPANEYRHLRYDNGHLDHIGYMPSHPSTKSRISPTKINYDERQSSHENNVSPHQKTVIKTSYINNPSHTIEFGQSNYGMEDFDHSTSFDRGSLSSTGTPVLPDLSSASSFEDPPLDFSSDASAFARDHFTTSTKILPDPSSESGSYNTIDIQKQVDSLHSMYQKLLIVVDKENKRKSKLNMPRITALQVKARSSNKQRTKDMKSASRRFARVESHVVTLARSVDHLRSELRLQSNTSRQLDELRVDVNEFKQSIYNNNYQTKHLQRSTEQKHRRHTLNKLKKFFGEEPPMVTILLQKMGYERFIPYFQAEEIGFLELPYMTEQRLQNLGIPLGPRLRILEEIQKVR